jgi:phage shock protein A
MLKPLERAWKYLVAALTGRLDQMADPEVQVEQAIDEAKRLHELLREQAAAVLGNRRELELKLTRQLEAIERLKASAREALILAEQAKSAGDDAKAQSFEDTGQTFATQLVQAEGTTRDLKDLHDQALAASDTATKAVEQYAMLLQMRLAERSRMQSQAEQTKLQERMNEALKSVSNLSVPGSVPALNEVRDKIEERYARAMGSAELASTNVEARMLEVEKAAIDGQGAQRLNEIRQSLAREKGGASRVESSGALAVESGEAEATPST